MSKNAIAEFHKLPIVNIEQKKEVKKEDKNEL